jgi:hypothetical protein
MLRCTVHAFDDIFAVDDRLNVLSNRSVGACRIANNGIGADDDNMCGDTPMPFLSIRVTKSASVSSDGEEV